MADAMPVSRWQESRAAYLRALHGAPTLLLLCLAAMAGLFLLSLVLILGQWTLGTGLPPRFTNVLYGSVAIGFCVIAASRGDGAQRRSWTLFALALLATTLADGLWLVAQVYDLPSLSDLSAPVYFTAMVPALVALVSYPVLSRLSMWRVLLIDAAVLVSAVLFLLHTLVLRHVVAGIPDVLTAAFLSSYPVGCSLLAALVLLVILRSEGPVRLDLVIGGFALTLFVVAGSAHALSTLPDADPQWLVLGDAAYAVVPLVVAAAAATAIALPTPPRTLRSHLPGVLSPLLPDLTALAALALAAVARPGGPVTTVLAVATLVSVGLRQVSQTASGERLRAQLERLVTRRTRELGELREEYRRLDAMKLEFVTAVSHELRTPLAAIRGSLEMLYDGDAGQLPKPALPMVSMAVRGSERLTRLVNDIIDLERLESGSFGFAPRTHLLPAIVSDAVASLESLAVEADVRLQVEITSRETVWCDADRITQVLVNLVGNALKFAPAGSSVTVAARRAAVPAELVVSVTNHGDEIPADQREAIFDRFHQVEMDESRQRGGAGLGLTISRHIVERHGGRIWTESGPAGTTFSFTLPDQVDPISESAPRPRPVPSTWPPPWPEQHPAGRV